MPAERSTSPQHWRAHLEARWRARLQEVTELSLAYHHAAAAAPDRLGGEPQARRLLVRAVAARRKLADIEEALGRLAAGHYGRCEQCGSPIGSTLLVAVPEARYCPGCAGESGPAGTGGAAQPDHLVEAGQPSAAA